MNSTSLFVGPNDDEDLACIVDPNSDEVLTNRPLPLI
ncbi:hypothetical protein SAMN05444392_106117 [Seinonella peptonophila]|uniref:Uncharacterized protein n=1 Tax=Seinonella peptonophila TaxID=112248 RepID=A0A1M4Y9L3_9BACL|nr:hypothetical protein SAMN05444392_106117 [Seinonella peptonophila]